MFLQEACNNGPNACGPLFGRTHCEFTPGICGTGLATAPDIATAQLHDSFLHAAAARSLSFDWSCPADDPPGGLPTGAGFLCYVTEEACDNGEDTGFSTRLLAFGNASQRALRRARRYSPDRPHRSLPRPASLRAGPNACSPTSPCVEGHPLCLTGISGGSFSNRTAGIPDYGQAKIDQPHTWFCPYDQPAGAQPNAFGAFCYQDAAACAGGSNSCNEAMPCGVV